MTKLKLIKGATPMKQARTIPLTDDMITELPPPSFWVAVFNCCRVASKAVKTINGWLHRAFWAHVFLAYLTGLFAVFIWCTSDVSWTPAKGRPLALRWADGPTVMVPNKKK